MTAHNAMANSIGFGETIRTLNGSLECGGQGLEVAGGDCGLHNVFVRGGKYVGSD
jgi:hypothetical protein